MSTVLNDKTPASSLGQRITFVTQMSNPSKPNGIYCMYEFLLEHSVCRSFGFRLQKGFTQENTRIEQLPEIANSSEHSLLSVHSAWDFQKHVRGLIKHPNLTAFQKCQTQCLTQLGSEPVWALVH